MTGEFSRIVRVGKDGSLDAKVWAAVVQAITHNFAGKQILVTVERFSKKRSLGFNSFYWAVIVAAISEYTGYDKMETHRLLKCRFAMEPVYLVNEKTGEISETMVMRSTAKMSQVDFREYIDSCVRLCAELGIELPPDEGNRYAYPEEHD